MSDGVVVRDVGKWFPRRDPDRATTLHEALTRGSLGFGRKEGVWALRDVDFRVGEGEVLGLIGPNGAGKSTLLRLVGGVGRPDRGEVVVHGRLSALLEVGAGFHPDLTGRENTFVNGIVHGLTRAEVAERLDDIVAFAELEEFIQNPLRTYSTGMQMRLGFAIAVHVWPDVLLVDEVLAVGDRAFQDKCLGRIEEYRRRGCAIILASHDLGRLRPLCDRVAWLDHGRIVEIGDPAAVLDAYESGAPPGALARGRAGE